MQHLMILSDRNDLRPKRHNLRRISWFVPSRWIYQYQLQICALSGDQQNDCFAKIAKRSSRDRRSGRCHNSAVTPRAVLLQGSDSQPDDRCWNCPIVLLHDVPGKLGREHALARWVHTLNFKPLLKLARIRQSLFETLV